jgi:hypothetical protein
MTIKRLLDAVERRGDIGRPAADGLDRKPPIARTVINLGLLTSDAHGNPFTAGAGKVAGLTQADLARAVPVDDG